MQAIVIRPIPATGADAVVLRVEKGHTAFLMDNEAAALLSDMLFAASEEIAAKLETDKHWPDYNESERKSLDDDGQRAIVWAAAIAPPKGGGA